MMRVSVFPLGPVQANGYLVHNENGKGIFIDPGAESQELHAFIEREKIEIEAILLTHAHFDHIGGLEEMRKRYSAPVYIHPNEGEWLGDPVLNGSGIMPFAQLVAPVSCRPADGFIEREGTFTVGSFTFEVLHTPGHSPGSLSYYIDGKVFCGDTLFRSSIGRTDLPGGNYEQLILSIQDKLLELPDETKVYPGHGPETTIGDEKMFNPFLTGILR